MKLKIFDIKWSITTAGPSPDNNNRIELFLFGCKKALVNPCKGCFNPLLWNNKKCKKTYSPKSAAKTINKFAPNKYISISGGEPMDQFPALLKLCKYLRKYNFHILVYTHHVLEENDPEYKNLLKLLKYIDIIIDGEYDETKRIYQTEINDGITNSIGSSNQRIIIKLFPNNKNLTYITHDVREYINWNTYYKNWNSLIQNKNKR